MADLKEEISREYYIIKVYKNGIKTIIKSASGESLFDVLLRNGFYMQNFCGGNHTCGKCILNIKQGMEIPMTEAEKINIEKQNRIGTERLACFIYINQDMDVYLNNDSNAKIIINGIENERSINPSINKIKINIKEANINYQRDDLQRLLDEVNVDNISYSLLKKIPELLKTDNKNLLCVIDDDEIISIEGMEDIDKTYGIAIDIGTTTIAAYLINLKDGKQIDSYSSLNPQRAYGADVISRIAYTIENIDGLEKVNSSIINEINNIINVFCERNKVNKANIYKVVAVGNTTMIHMFLNIPCKKLANSPFIPGFTKKLKIKARDIGIEINNEGYVSTLPNVSAYIGADTIGAVLAAEMAQNKDISLLLDIGTNGEIVLGNSEGLYCCSAAAGPAFEGANITFGTGGIEGAIDHVNFNNDPIYSTIGEKPGVGICGSGVLDSIAELIKYSIVDKRGRMKKKEELDGKIDDWFCERIIEHKKRPAFMLSDNKGIYITSSDIREVQLAKAAIYGGIMVLIKAMGISLKDIKRVYLAGGFGNYLDVENSIKVGLIPSELKGKVIAIGNGAGSGAKMVLVSKEMEHEAEEIKSKIKYVELSSSLDFQNEFINGMNFN